MKSRIFDMFSRASFHQTPKQTFIKIKASEQMVQIGQKTLIVQ